MHSEVVITERILASKKYRALYRPTVERVVADCVSRFGADRAEDEARTILHQIWGSYYPARPDFKKLLVRFAEQLAAGDRAAAIDDVLRLHASSAERQSAFDDFYRSIFALTGTPSSIVDHGCCLDPIAFERLGLPAATKYQAFDIDTEEVSFLRQACQLLGYGASVQVSVGDIIADAPVPADVVFMLKLLPVLEQQKKGSARDALMKQQCKWLVVSYPVASLSGKEKGMTEFYTKQFMEMTAGLHWKIERLLFPTELVFVVGK